MRVAGLLGAAVVAAGWLLSRPAAAESYHYTTIYVPGSDVTEGLGINNLDQVVGYVSPTPYYQRGFVWSAGQFSFVDAPAAGPSHLSTFLEGINDHGEICGFRQLISHHQYVNRAFKINGGVLKLLPFDADHDGSVALGISRNGTIVGNLNHPQAFTYRAGTVTPYQIGSSGTPNATAINDRGDFTGSAAVHGTYMGFVHTDGGFTLFSAAPGSHDPHLPAASTWPLTINRAGIVGGGVYAPRENRTLGFLRRPDGSIGLRRAFGSNDTEIMAVGPGGEAFGYYLDDVVGAQHAFLENHGVYQHFEPPGSTASAIEAINERGTVLGGALLDGHWTTFIATCATGPGSCTP